MGPAHCAAHGQRARPARRIRQDRAGSRHPPVPAARQRAPAPGPPGRRQRGAHHPPAPSPATRRLDDRHEARRLRMRALPAGLGGRAGRSRPHGPARLADRRGLRTIKRLCLHRAEAAGSAPGLHRFGGSRHASVVPPRVFQRGRLCERPYGHGGDQLGLTVADAAARMHAAKIRHLDADEYRAEACDQRLRHFPPVPFRAVRRRCSPLLQRADRLF